MLKIQRQLFSRFINSHLWTPGEYLSMSLQWDKNMSCIDIMKHQLGYCFLLNKFFSKHLFSIRKSWCKHNWPSFSKHSDPLFSLHELPPTVLYCPGPASASLASCKAWPHSASLVYSQLKCCSCFERVIFRFLTILVLLFNILLYLSLATFIKFTLLKWLTGILFPMRI